MGLDQVLAYDYYGFGQQVSPLSSVLPSETNLIKQNYLIEQN